MYTLIFLLFIYISQIWAKSIIPNPWNNDQLKSIFENKMNQLKSIAQRNLNPVTLSIGAYGNVTGFNDGNTTHFLGVPFAAPPVGNLRWKSPINPAPWGHINTTWVSLKESIN